MLHECDDVDFFERSADARQRVRAADGAVSGPHSAAQAREQKPARDGSDRPAFAVGSVCRGLDAAEIQITRIDRDFVHWLNRFSQGHGRMLKAHFLNFFTPVSQ